MYNMGPKDSKHDIVTIQKSQQDLAKSAEQSDNMIHIMKGNLNH